MNKQKRRKNNRLLCVRQIVARCPKCKSTHLIALSSRMTANGRIRRVQCLEDGCNLVFAVLLV